MVFDIYALKTFLKGNRSSGSRRGVGWGTERNGGKGGCCWDVLYEDERIKRRKPLSHTIIPLILTKIIVRETRMI